MKSFDLVVASHLRWSFVWQRPQQLLSRLAQNHRILFIEEPVYADASRGALSPQLAVALPNLMVLTPQVEQERCGDTPLWLWPEQERITAQIKNTLSLLEFDRSVLWFYTPTPEFLVDVVKPKMLTYDVMDELANFKFAPPQLKERERRLLTRSSVVFTGGASLYDAKRRFNPNTHLFASGVDGAHYERACNPNTEAPEWMEQIPGPRAVYIGVIDERLDYDLIAAMANARPEIQFLMCGPIVKVDPAALPQGPNLHYPGQQAYADLPRILKGADVCLMPFARNEATKYISPTKTLEYMATHRPIVSTPIKDVERFYSDIVYLADSAEDFIACIDAALSEAPADRARKRLREEKILAEQAWDAIAENMRTLLLREWNRVAPAREPARERLLQIPVPARNGRSSVAEEFSASSVSGGE